ncbi:odorant receptor 131-2-like [Leuresthes tenuis]|uniref:odorant receptor 131-2-like n=1 Tax=Leuresthes tenuis TaxID=355514 RepID=UPI003B509721
MANNSSLSHGLLRKIVNDQGITAHVLVIIFLCINLLLIVTFFKKECFHTSARYILFAVMLLSDSFMLIMSDVLLILSFFQYTMQVWLCAIISVVVLLYSKVTPITLTAMTLERYVAICMPLRHAELCSTHNTMHCILIIYGISSIYCIVIFFMFFASASYSFYKQNKVCSVEMFIMHSWQDHVRSAVNQMYSLVMCIIIIISYDKIMKVAKAASGESKKSTQKGLQTVVLHAFQLLLCLIRLWCPFIEAAVFRFDVSSYTNVMYFNYIMFSLAPRCLSSLIYGLRDETFCLALKSYVCFGLTKRNYV